MEKIPLKQHKMKTKTMNCKPFAANYIGNCHITGETIKIGDRVYYDPDNNLCLLKNFKKPSKTECNEHHVLLLLERLKVKNDIAHIAMHTTKTLGDGVRVDMVPAFKTVHVDFFGRIWNECILNDWGANVTVLNNQYVLYFYDNQKLLWK